MLRKWGIYAAIAAFAFLCGADFGLAWVKSVTPMEDTPALLLPDHFATLDDSNSGSDYVAFFVGRPSAVWGEVAVPHAVRKDGFDKIYYTTNAGERLVHANISTSDGWHRLDIVDWQSKVVAHIAMEDAGARSVTVTDAFGKVLAQGSRSAETGAITLSSPQGMRLATIAPSTGGHWAVAIDNCSKISKATYALLVGYETMISTGRAVSI